MVDRPSVATITGISKKSEKYKDISGILFLTFLYILQGMPLGLASSVPYLLQSDTHTASYRYQAIFSWVFWAFSLKLAWAPIVDSVYIGRIGRRKTWLIPVQYALGIDCFVIASQVDNWLGRQPDQPWGPLGVTGEVQIWALTFAFLGLTFLAATQDIVVDGWALTVLSKENLGWASTCNILGQTLGYILGFIVFLALESPDVCNNYLRSNPIPDKGIVSFSGFLYFCGGVFVVSTTLVALLKTETKDVKPCCRSRRISSSSLSISSTATAPTPLDEPLNPQLLREHGHLEVFLVPEADTASTREFKVTRRSHLSLLQTYLVALKVLTLRPVLRYIAFIFLVKSVFSAGDSIFGLKVLEHGVPKALLALISSAVLPLQALLPLLVTHWSNGPRPLSVYLNAALPRALMVPLTVLIIHYVDHFRTTIEPPLGSVPDTPPTYSFAVSFYVLLLGKFAIYSILSHTMFTCQMAFHARISDPSIGGTYMTLLNTVSNLAGSLPSTLMLFMVDPLTVKKCDGPVENRLLGVLNNWTTTTMPLSLEQRRQLADDFLLRNATCTNPSGIKACRLAGGSCRTIVDGFYVEVAFCLLTGLVAYCTVLRRMAKTFTSLPPEAYHCHLRSYQPPFTCSSPSSSSPHNHLNNPAPSPE